MSFRFTQAGAPLSALGGETHRLQAVEGEPAFARLCDADAALDAVLDYRLELVTDTGVATEPYGIVMLVAFDVPAERVEEVDRWYDEEHIRLLMQADGWLRARRFRVIDHRGKRWTSMAFHELRDIAAMDSEGRRIARSTPWRAELEREDWFRAAGRWVFRPDHG